MYQLIATELFNDEEEEKAVNIEGTQKIDNFINMLSPRNSKHWSKLYTRKIEHA